MPRITPAARAPAQLAANCGSWKPVPSEIRMKANALPAALTRGQSIVPLKYDTSTPLVVAPAALSTSEPRPAPALESPAGSPPTAQADSSVTSTSPRMMPSRSCAEVSKRHALAVRAAGASAGEHRARRVAPIAQPRSHDAKLDGERP